MADRVRMQQLSLSTVALGQGVSFFHAGTDMLRSKSLDRNSYDSGDHFNELDFSYQSNGFGVGLPPAPDNESKWRYMRPLLEDPALKPAKADIVASVERFRDLLRVADSSPLFSLTTAEQVQEKLQHLNTGADQIPGLLVMHLDDTVGDDVDPARERVVVLINATDAPQSYTVAQLAQKGLTLSAVQAAGADPVVKGATFAGGTFTVPARTTAVFEERSTLEVQVRVRPGNGTDVVNTRSGQVQVAVLSQDGFDPVTDLDVDALRFGVTGLEDSVLTCRPGRDYDGDGGVDLLCQVRVRDTGLSPGDTRLQLRGSTVDGVRVAGTASVTTEPPRGRPGRVAR